MANSSDLSFSETSARQCYVNKSRAFVVSYSDGASYLLFFGTSLHPGDGTITRLIEWRDSAAKGVHSLHQMSNSVKIESADDAGILAVVPGATICWEGSEGYAALKAAVTRRPGGGNYGSKSSGSGAPAVVVSGDAFMAPTVAAVPVLADLVGKMAPVVDALNAWALDYSTALMADSEVPADPAQISVLSPMMPGLSDAFGAFRAAVSSAVKSYKETQAAKAAERAAAEEAAKKAAEAAANGKKLITLPDGSTVEIKGKTHAEFAAVCQLVKRGRNVYLYGPAGTGKTYLCKQIADALELPFWSDQKISNEFQLTGFVDASGKYQETELYRAVVGGGVYMLDEFDASDECAAVVLNTALANGYMTFPGVGRVDVHPDFHCIACGNTIGRGADSDYTGRNCLDAATLDRFVIRAVGYDAEIELQKANGDQDLVNFIHAVRSAVASCGVSLVVSMRAIENIAAVSDCFPAAECLEMGLFKGLEKDQIKQISSAVSGRGKWFDALKKLAA